jgi:adenosine deaminase
MRRCNGGNRAGSGDERLVRRLAAQLPKAELHAHINGCIRDATLTELCRASDDPVARRFVVPPAEERSLMQCFEMFDIIHAAVSDLDAVARVASEAVADFAADGVCYCELRTTPRADCRRGRRRRADVADSGDDQSGEGGSDSGGAESQLASRREYVAAVVQSVRDAEAAQRGEVVVRLLLSIDRAGTLEAARETVHLAAQEFGESGSGLVVGLDFSGNPHSGRFADFRSVFEEARERYGLPLTAHVGELPDHADTAATIEFGPERYGHAVAGMSPALLAALVGGDQKRSQGNAGRGGGGGGGGAVEICPTSNLRTLELPAGDYGAHPTLGYWLRGEGASSAAAAVAAATAHAPPRPHPGVCICTDDTALFGITLSDELGSVGWAYGLPPPQLAQLALGALEHAFAPESVLAPLRRRAHNRAEQLLRRQGLALLAGGGGGGDDGGGGGGGGSHGSSRGSHGCHPASAASAAAAAVASTCVWPPPLLLGPASSRGRRLEQGGGHHRL